LVKKADVISSLEERVPPVPTAAIFVGLIFEVFIGAIILVAAADLYNKMAGGPSTPSAVPKLAYGKALGIVFLIHIIVVVFWLLIFQGDASSMNLRVLILAQLATILIALTALTLLLFVMLPTSLGKAVLVRCVTSWSV
jgi:hypothetical protein